VTGCATPTSSAGHAGATANLKLTFHLDHSVGADQCSFWRLGSIMKTTPRISISVRRGFACAGRRAMRIRLVRCSGRRGTTHAIPLKALSCTRRRLTSSGRPNDGFLDSASPPTIFDQLSQVERRCADARGRDGGVREELAAGVRAVSFWRYSGKWISLLA